MQLFVHPESSKYEHSYRKTRPTVLDELSLDVIRVYIFPCLDYESRINLNLCLPSWDRLSRRIDKKSMEMHDFKVVSQAITCVQYKILDSYEDTTEIFTLFTKLLKMHLLPRYFNIISSNDGYRNVTIRKISEFIDTCITYKGRVDLDTRLRLVKICSKLRKKIEDSGPYVDNPNAYMYVYMLAPVLTFD